MRLLGWDQIVKWLYSIKAFGLFLIGSGVESSRIYNRKVTSSGLYSRKIFHVVTRLNNIGQMDNLWILL